jgi:predicted MFS family arabinose efflux permease
MPVLALAFGWRSALLAIVAAGFAIAVSAQPTRASLDSDRSERASFSLRGLFAPLRLIVGNPTLIELSLTGFFYAATQMCLMSFLVVYLTEALQRPLVWAGLALTVTNVGGIIGRIVWGGVADRWIAPRRLLGIIGVVAGACSLATAAFSSSLSSPLLLAVCAIFGASAIGWNGVQLSEVARNAPAGQAGAVTGASGFITFSGVMLGPPLFAAMAALTETYRIGFAFFGITSIACGVWLVSRKL